MPSASNLKFLIAKNWITVFLLSALWLFLLFLIITFLPGLQPNWQEIKNSASPMAGKTREASFEQKTIFGQETSRQPPVNFLVLGAAGRGYDAPDLTDTILVVRFEPASEKLFLFSLPRDLLVKIPGSGNWTKLNALYAIAKNSPGHEFDLIRKKAQEITGLTIDHYIFVDLATVKELVDTLGGVNVMVKKDLSDPTFPGPNHSFEPFSIEAGWRYLDGETALKYMRSRHSASGDFDRIARQQEILQALKQKVLQLNFWDLPTFLNIFNTLAGKIKTDLSLWQMKAFWDQVKDIPAQNTARSEINTTQLMTTGQTYLGSELASVVQPKTGIENYEEIQKYITETINTE